MTELAATTPNGNQRDGTGRFARGNTAARRHGLRAGSRVELRRKNRRVSRLARRLAEAFADAGRPLEGLSLPTAWKWSELEVLRTDLFAAVQADPSNSKHYDSYLATCRLQLSVERELRMTPGLVQQLRGGEPDIVLQFAEAARRKQLSD